MNVNRIPKIHRMIATVVAANTAIVGTHHLCEILPAPRQSILSSLRTWNKYGLLDCRHANHPCGRGHKTTWMITRKGKRYVQSK